MAGETGAAKAPLEVQPELKKFGLWDFLNSQFGLWLLGSVVVGLISLAWNTRLAHENDQREDSQFLASMLPYLTNPNLETRVRAAQVIASRYPANGIPIEIRQVMCGAVTRFADVRLQQSEDARLTFDEYVAGNCQQEETARAQVGAAPAASPAAGQTPAPQATPVTSAHVYIQIYDEAQRDNVRHLQEELRNGPGHFIEPGIENVSGKIPGPPVKTTEVRYFNDVDAPAAKYIADFLRGKRITVADPKQLPQRANPGTIEIWFAPTDLAKSAGNP